jgi:intraflagellar transport protein 172
MFIHQQDWAGATQVAEVYEAAAIPDVLVAQARVAVSADDLECAETLFVSAKKPQLALEMYQDAERWSDAVRFCEEHLPDRLAEVKQQFSKHSQG